MRFKAVVTYIRSPELVAKEFRNLLKKNLRLVGELWHEKYLPKHFEEYATQRYGYRKRTQAYEKRKLRKFGHKKPLVWSGRMQREMQRRRQVTGTSKAVKVRMKAPTYGRYHDKLKDATRTTMEESRFLAKALHRAMIWDMEHLKEHKTMEVS